jgi:hypothetical protein
VDSLALTQLSAAIGTALPIVASVVKQDRFSPRANALMSAGLALATAAVVALFAHRFTPGGIGLGFTAMYTTAVAFHHGLWKPTGIAPAIQTRTSRRVRRAPVQVQVPAQRRRDLSRC